MNDITSTPSSTPPGAPSESNADMRALIQYMEQEKTKRTQRKLWFRLARTLVWIAALIIIFSLLARSCSAPSISDSFGLDGSSAHTGSMEEPHIAVVNLEGAVNTSNSESVIALIEEVSDNENAQGLIVYVDTGGGGVKASSDVYDAMMMIKDTRGEDFIVNVVVGDGALSGGYYAASAGDNIYANRHSMIGSIGVIMSKTNVEGLFDKLGLKDMTYTAGTYKDITSGKRQATPFEQRFINDLISGTHEIFIADVLAGRGDRLDEKAYDLLFSGLLWNAPQAERLGLIDGIATLDEVAAMMDDSLEIVEYTQPLGFDQQILGYFVQSVANMQRAIQYTSPIEAVTTY